MTQPDSDTARLIQSTGLAIMLGSGLGGVCEGFDIAWEVPFSVIPDVGTSGVEGHDGSVRVCEVLSNLSTPAYIVRVKLNAPSGIPAAKQALRKAFTYQNEGRCFTLVEFVSTCPTNWGMSPRQACEWATSDMLPYYPVKEYKTPDDPLPKGLFAEDGDK